MKQTSSVKYAESIVIAISFILAFRFPAASGRGYLEAISAFLFITMFFLTVIRGRHLAWLYLAVTSGFINILYWVPNTIAIKGPLPYPLAILACGLICCWEAFGLISVAIYGRWAYHRGGPVASACGSALLMMLLEVYSFHIYHWSWGATLGGVPWLAKSASLFGTHGLTALMWICGAWTGTSIATKRGYKQILCGPIVFISILTISASIWKKLPRGPQRVLNIVIVQPNFTPGLRDPHMEQDMWQRSDKQLKLLGWPITNVATLLIWPESSVLGRDDQQPSTRMRLEAKNRHIAWLFGTEGGGFNLVRGETAGQSSFIQAKVEPMPFGERMPGPNSLRQWLDQYTGFISQKPGFLTKESSFQLLTPQGEIKIHPIICSEATISSRVQDGISIAGGDLLTNHTNDGWFEQSPTTDLHAAEIRLRAVETGLPLIRATLTGKSGIFREDGSWILWGKSMTEAAYGFQLCWRPVMTPARNPYLTQSIMVILFLVSVGSSLFFTTGTTTYTNRK